MMFHPKCLIYNSVKFVTTVFAICLLLPPAVKVTHKVINTAMLSPRILHICHHTEYPCVICLLGVDLTNISAQLHKEFCFHFNWYFLYVAQMTGRKGRVVQTEDGVQYESRSEVDVPLETLNLTG